MGRALGVPVILTYHCDLRLPASPVNWLANHVSRLANHISASFANVVVTNTLDYAEHSDFLRRYREKWHVIPPPIETVPVDPAIVARMRERYSVKPGQAIIGMAARLATEKGAEVLARALPMILESLPEARVLYAGQYLDVMGEEEYARRLEPTLNALGEHWTFLGTLSPEEMSAFYSLCDVTVLPSLNSTESFGMVLVESMFCGTPVVSSDLPGMRRPPIVTGMGLTFPVGDAGALAEAILQVIQAPEAFRPDDPSVLQAYSSDQAAVAFEKLFRTQLQDHA
jgi:glycosyltransferase involved in cell wall biosynthesis